MITKFSFKKANKFTLITFILPALFLYGCATHVHEISDGAPTRDIDVSNVHDAVPKIEPKSAYGNPASYTVFGKHYFPMKSCKGGYTERGIASWYGTKFHQQKTSSGEPFNLYAMTAAHRTLPLPTYVRVTNLENNRCAIVKVNDRGPFKANRIIDLSYAAAKKLGVTARGTALVSITTIDPQRPQVTAICPPKPMLNGHHKLYLQVGAFGQMQNAQLLQVRVKKITRFPVRIQSTTCNKKSIFRVQIGPLPNPEQLDALSAQLKKQNIGSAVVHID